VSPTGWRRLALLAAMAVAVSVCHYLTPTRVPALHALYRWLYHLPVILGAFWFGAKGGIGIAALVTVLYLPHLTLHWHGGQAEQWLEVALYFLVGGVTGFLSTRQRKERDRYRRAAEELDRAYAELKDRTRLLLETEDQLRRADRLNALGQLSAGLAHEVKTPLASIRGTAEILAAEQAPAEREEFSGILLREVDRLNRVVNEFLDFARPKDPRELSADPAAAVEEVLRLVRVEAERAGVAVRTVLEDGLPRVAVDPEQLTQVVLNLVMNGIQAMVAGGELVVGTGRDGEDVLLTIEDTGPGIPEDVRKRVFDPFFTTREKGTGLGLSIVHKILEGHGASIALLPREGGGTRVEVRMVEEGGADGRTSACR